MKHIITSNIKNKTNWTGTEFSNEPLKIYASFEDAMKALQTHWFGNPNSECKQMELGRSVYILPFNGNDKLQANTAQTSWWHRILNRNKN